MARTVAAPDFMSRRAHALVVKGRQQPIGEGMAQMELPLVFKQVNQLPDDSAAAETRDGMREMKRALVAIRARKLLLDRAREWLGAGGAKRSLDAARAF